MQFHLRIRQIIFSGRKDLHGAGFELRDFCLWIEHVISKQIRGGFGKMERDEDDSYRCFLSP